MLAHLLAALRSSLAAIRRIFIRTPPPAPPKTPKFPTGGYDTSSVFMPPIEDDQAQ